MSRLSIRNCGCPAFRLLVRWIGKRFVSASFRGGNPGPGTWPVAIVLLGTVPLLLAWAGASVEDGACGVVQDEKPAEKASAGDIEKLIERLGNDDFASRDAASKALLKVGDDALPTVQSDAGAQDNKPTARSAPRVRSTLTQSTAGGPAGSSVADKKNAAFDPLHTIADEADGVRCLVFSPDGKTLAAASCKDGTIRFWDVASGKQRKTVFTHSGPMVETNIVFSPNGELFASTRIGKDGGLRLWDLKTEKELARVDDLWHATAVAFDPTGKTLAVLDASELLLFDVEKKKVIHRQLFMEARDRGLGAVWLAFSPDGKKLVHTGHTSPRLIFWDCEARKEEKVIVAAGSMWPVYWSKDGKNLIAVGPYSDRKCVVSYWDLAKGAIQAKLEPRGNLGGIGAITLNLTVSGDEKYLAVGNPEGHFELWNCMTGKSCVFERRWLPAISPDGKRFACGRIEDGRELIEIWDFSKLRKFVD